MIRYLTGGKLGDFIHSLSVVNEKYLETGQKGIVYVSDQGIGGGFAYPLEVAYQHIKEILDRQEYIHSFLIHQGEGYDVDLTEWRNCDYVSRSYPQTMNDYYSVPWGKHPWIQNIPFDVKWADKTVVWTIESRFPHAIQWPRFIHDDLIFISFDKKDYDYFCQTTHMTMEFYSPRSLLELCMILRSCRRYVASYSGPLALAFALHTPCFIGELHRGELFCRDFEKVLPNIFIDFWS